MLRGGSRRRAGVTEGKSTEGRGRKESAESWREKGRMGHRER